MMHVFLMLIAMRTPVIPLPQDAIRDVQAMLIAEQASHARTTHVYSIVPRLVPAIQLTYATVICVIGLLHHALDSASRMQIASMAIAVAQESV
jgi:hypothetical protein